MNENKEKSCEISKEDIKFCNDTIIEKKSLKVVGNNLKEIKKAFEDLWKKE